MILELKLFLARTLSLIMMSSLASLSCASDFDLCTVLLGWLSATTVTRLLLASLCSAGVLSLMLAFLTSSLLSLTHMTQLSPSVSLVTLWSGTESRLQLLVMCLVFRESLLQLLTTRLFVLLLVSTFLEASILFQKGKFFTMSLI